MTVDEALEHPYLSAYVSARNLHAGVICLSFFPSTTLKMNLQSSPLAQPTLNSIVCYPDSDRLFP